MSSAKRKAGESAGDAKQEGASISIETQLEQCRNELQASQDQLASFQATHQSITDDLRLAHEQVQSLQVTVQKSNDDLRLAHEEKANLLESSTRTREEKDLYQALAQEEFITLKSQIKDLESEIGRMSMHQNVQNREKEAIAKELKMQLEKFYHLEDQIPMLMQQIDEINNLFMRLLSTDPRMIPDFQFLVPLMRALTPRDNEFTHLFHLARRREVYFNCSMQYLKVGTILTRYKKHCDAMKNTNRPDDYSTSHHQRKLLTDTVQLLQDVTLLVDVSPTDMIDDRPTLVLALAMYKEPLLDLKLLCSKTLSEPYNGKDIWNSFESVNNNIFRTARQLSNPSFSHGITSPMTSPLESGIVPSFRLPQIQPPITPIQTVLAPAPASPMMTPPSNITSEPTQSSSSSSSTSLQPNVQSSSSSSSTSLQPNVQSSSSSSSTSL